MTSNIHKHKYYYIGEKLYENNALQVYFVFACECGDLIKKIPRGEIWKRNQS